MVTFLGKKLFTRLTLRSNRSLSFCNFRYFQFCFRCQDFGSDFYRYVVIDYRLLFVWSGIEGLFSMFCIHLLQMGEQMRFNGLIILARLKWRHKGSFFEKYFFLIIFAYLLGKLAHINDISHYLNCDSIVVAIPIISI